MTKVYMNIPEMAEVRLARPRAIAEAENFILMVVLRLIDEKIESFEIWFVVVIKEADAEWILKLMMISTVCDHGHLYTDLLRLPYTASFHTSVIATVVHGNDGQKTREIHGLVDDAVRLATTVSAGDCVQAVLDRQVEQVSS